MSLNIPKVSNVGGAKAEKQRNFRYLRTAYMKKYYYKPIVLTETVHSEAVPFGDLNSPDVRNPTKNFGVQ